MKSIFIKDLVKDQIIDGELFSIIKSQKNLTKSGDEYYRIEVGDKTGSLVGNVWKDNIKNIGPETLVVGKVGKIYAKVEEYKGSLQLNYYSIGEASEYDLSDFISVSKRDVGSMIDDFEKHIESITDEDYQSLIQKLMSNEQFKTLIYNHPAAEKLHHSFKHGLLEHMMEMLDVADTVIKYYPYINIDLVKTGIIFHDVGKIFELSQEGTTYIRTLEGKLIGHIGQGYELLLSLIDANFPEDKALKLKHIVLSHHGTLEFGSPIVPKTIEAQVVSSIDDLSAQIRNFDKIINDNSSADAEFSGYDPLLKREIYLK